MAVGARRPTSLSLKCYGQVQKERWSAKAMHVPTTQLTKNTNRISGEQNPQNKQGEFRKQGIYSSSTKKTSYYCEKRNTIRDFIYAHVFMANKLWGWRAVSES